jgi:hypothetical protein
MNHRDFRWTLSVGDTALNIHHLRRKEIIALYMAARMIDTNHFNYPHHRIYEYHGYIDGAGGRANEILYRLGFRWTH